MISILNNYHNIDIFSIYHTAWVVGRLVGSQCECQLTLKVVVSWLTIEIQLNVQHDCPSQIDMCNQYQMPHIRLR